MQITKHENAIISWLNTLNIQTEPITSIDELKDGIVFAKLLNKM